jgi:DNA repair photolyase
MGVLPIVLRMPLEIKDLFREWLEEHYPDRAAHVLSLIRDMRGGKDYDATWGQRMKGKGPYAAQLGLRFRMAARRLGLNEPSEPLDVTQFKPPAQVGDQMSFL